MAFQFTPLREGRRALRYACGDFHYFNSRPSARGDILEFRNSVFQIYFNSRPSARGDRTAALHAAIAALFQFTPLREGRLPGVRESGRRENFNSRPSARGDYDKPFWGVCEAISIHAPPRGATPTPGLPDAGKDFNSRPSARGDGRVVFLSFVAFHFNSRPSARGDHDGQRRTSAATTFQFTPLREGRRCSPGQMPGLI